jgi:O-antigen ligase
MAALGAIATVALFASGSRSAWIGVVLAVLVIVWRRLPSRQARVVMAVSCVGVAVLAASLFVALRDNTDVQNAILHTQTNSHVATTSNSAHLDATVDGLRDVVHQPLGDGPGTAGPASAHNGTHGVRVAENYYVQIAQETGWLGLTLFIAIVTLVAAELYQRAKTSPLALTLLAALVGMSFVNLLSHAWADDTLAFLWWGLAGIALSAPPAKKGKHARVSSAGKLA